MRRLCVLLALASCSVPEKNPSTTDGGTNDTGSGGPLETMITEAPGEFSNASLATFRFTAKDRKSVV